MDKMQRTPSPKKRRMDAANPDLDMTPRAPHYVPSQPPIAFSTSSSRGSTSDASSQPSGTGASSPRKQLAALAADPDGMVRRLLRTGAKGLPSELADMYKTLRNCNLGVGVVSQAQEAAIVAEAARNPTFDPLPDFAFADAAQRDRLGVTPPIDAVLDILSWANHSFRAGASEASWNGDVHSMLLKLAVHGGYRRQEQLVDVANCTTAGIIREYLTSPLVSKKVDFCIVLDPSATDEVLADRIDERRRALPFSSINHTDLDSLVSRPIVVSIETKRDGGSLEQAQLQTATWQTAQWSLLSRLVGGGSDLPCPLDSLPFLPAVIIQGHDWSLAATVRQGAKTILWYDCPFGDTRDALGIYKIVYGIQTLVAYSKDVFWPWYQNAVLGARGVQDGLAV